MRRLQIVGVTFCALVLFLAYQIVNISGFGVDADRPPQVITNNIVDPAQLTEVSKFRSAAGHSFAGRGETCSSMKHYFIATHDAQAFAARLASGHQLAPDGKSDLLIRAPFDGMVTQRMKNPISGELFAIAAADNHAMVLMLDHIFVAEGLHSGPIPYLYLLGTKVKAGQVIGRVNGNEGFDVEFRVGGPPWSDKWSSYFMGLTDAAFNPWQTMTGNDRSHFVITKEYRQAHPIDCKEDGDSNSDFKVPALANDANSYVIFKASQVEQVATQGNANDVCDAEHIGAVRKNDSGSFICKKAPDGRIIWNPNT